MGVLRVEVFLQTPQNLKEKRGIVRRLLGRCRSRFPVSAAEVDHQDLWQRATLGFAMVEQEEKEIDPCFTRIEREILLSGLVEITASDREFLHY
ncbi:MAG: DUF503 domain-containing protein [Deltaproteobacteria bacterium]|nr:DUF503 domain-containing protein [Deltaproteobacteria bacterium]